MHRQVARHRVGGGAPTSRSGEQKELEEQGLSLLLTTAGAAEVSRELQAGTDSSVITASTDARPGVSQTATDMKEGFP